MTKKEFCAGIIPIRLTEEKSWQILLALHVKGDYWSFPKGHVGNQENPYSAAERELFEETHLKVERLYEHPPLKEDYEFERDGQPIHKSVTYYPAFVKGEMQVKEPQEVIELQWVSIPEGIMQITFDPTRKMIEPLIQSLTLNA